MVLHPQTRENLLHHAAGGVVAFAMYLLYAAQARQPAGGRSWPSCVRPGGQPGVLGHFAEQALDAAVIGMEAENLHLAIEEEAFEAEVMYRDFQAQAEAVGECRRRRTTSGASARTSGATATSSWPPCGLPGPGRPGRVGRA